MPQSLFQFQPSSTQKWPVRTRQHFQHRHPPMDDYRRHQYLVNWSPAPTSISTPSSINRTSPASLGRSNQISLNEAPLIFYLRRSREGAFAFACRDRARALAPTSLGCNSNIPKPYFQSQQHRLCRLASPLSRAEAPVVRRITVTQASLRPLDQTCFLLLGRVRAWTRSLSADQVTVTLLLHHKYYIHHSGIWFVFFSCRCLLTG